MPMFDALVKIAKDREANPDLLIELVQEIRPSKSSNHSHAIEKFSDMLFVLEKDEYLLSGFRTYVHRLLKNRKFSSLVADLGIISEGGFTREISKRFYNKILPVQHAESGMEYVVSNVFYNANDAQWFSKIAIADWEKLFDLLAIKPIQQLNSDSFAMEQLLFAIELLAMRICGTAMDYSLLKMVPELENLDSPFISLQKDIVLLIDKIKSKGIHGIQDDIDAKHVNLLLKQCRDYLQRAIRNKEKFGISFYTTIKLVRMQQQLTRLQMLLDYIMPNNDEYKHGKTIKLMQHVIELNSNKNNVGSFWRETTKLVSYQITQHSGKTGEHYITETKDEYYKMLYSAAGGGVVVGMLSLFKMHYSYIDTSLFGHAFYYSINYALGFIAIYLMHFTLATKQPAMTAATLAAAVEPVGEKLKVDYTKFASLFSRLFRSQFIAFVGNVFFALPTAILMVYAWQWIFGVQDIVTPEKTTKLLKETNIFKSPALSHAAVAGIYLFLSGLISGYYINRNIHDGISKRIQKHPLLRRFLPATALEKIASFYNKHIGGLSGNFWLGVFLGTTGAVGVFFGLNIDIRHITFSAGNFGLALVGSQFQIGFWQILAIILTIGLIGFVNFIVSFSLSLTVALRSRGLRFKELIPIGAAIWVAFLKNKKVFFFPPNKEVLPLEAESTLFKNPPNKQ